MKNPISHYVFLMACLVLFSCSGKEQDTTKIPGQKETIKVDGQKGTKKVAEQIVYDVEIKNPYPDDKWMTECLQGLDHEALVDFVFTGIYNETFSAYKIFEETPLSSRDIKKMEEDGVFTRKQIGKFQFMEEWILDTVHMTYFKEVKEIRMGLQKFNVRGDLTGYEALFRVVL